MRGEIINIVLFLEVHLSASFNFLKVEKGNDQVAVYTKVCK